MGTTVFQWLHLPRDLLISSRGDKSVSLGSADQEIMVYHSRGPQLAYHIIVNGLNPGVSVVRIV